jgi:preprotein translocase subunit SecA
MFAGMMEGIKEESVRLLLNHEIEIQRQGEDGPTMIVLKGLAEARRPQQLEYTAPSVDGGERVQRRVEGAGTGGAHKANRAARRKAGAAARPAAAGARQGAASASGAGAAAPSGVAAPPGGEVSTTTPATASAVASTATNVEPSAELEFGDVPRNAPCPCGSGRKYKRCHGDPRNREN